MASLSILLVTAPALRKRWSATTVTRQGTLLATVLRARQKSLATTAMKSVTLPGTVPKKRTSFPVLVQL